MTKLPIKEPVVVLPWCGHLTQQQYHNLQSFHHAVCSITGNLGTRWMLETPNHEPVDLLPCTPVVMTPHSSPTGVSLFAFTA